jgi:hypothetical protein
MKVTDVLRTTGWEGVPLTVMHRVQGNAGSNITQASLTAITCTVYDVDDAMAVVNSPAVVIANAVFDTLQTTALDPRWTADSTGYNFRFTLPAASFPLGRRYLVKFTFDPVSGEDFLVLVEHRTLETP